MKRRKAIRHRIEQRTALKKKLRAKQRYFFRLRTRVNSSLGIDKPVEDNQEKKEE